MKKIITTFTIILLASLGGYICSNEADNTKFGFFDDIKDRYPTRNIEILANGVAKTKIYTYNSTVHAIFVNKKYNENIYVKPFLANDNSLKGLRYVSNMCVKNNALACVNGTYFSLNNGMPLGLIKKDNEVLTGDIYGRAGIGIIGNSYYIDRIYSNIKANNVIIDKINQPRMLSIHTIVYNSKWGNLSPNTPKYGMQVVVEDGKVVKTSYTACQIPQNGYVIVGPKKKLELFKIGQHIKLVNNVSPENMNKAEHIITGGPILVKDDEIFIDTNDEKLTAINGYFARTAVGYTKDNMLIIVTVDRGGVSLYQLATIMKSLGCTRAINLDGGTSTNLYIKNQGLLANGSRGNTRPVSNIFAIGLKK